MQYANLGATELKVSRLCLGTVFRSGVSEADCLATVAAAADLGCNFIDCANVYRSGLSERVVGKALVGRRGRFVVSTKVGARTDGARSGGGLRRQAILSACEASLRQLGTDYLDCYLCHFPDPETPIEETLAAMDLLVGQGKVRYIGGSNFESWRLCEALHASAGLGLASFVCDQVLYSLLDRRIEDELLPFCERRKIGVTAYATTAIGLLSGRYRYGQPPPPGSSWHRGPYNYRAAMTPHVDQVIQCLTGVAGRHGRTPTQVAMAWCLRRPGVDAAIIGTDTPEQARENFAAADWVLPEEEGRLLDQVSEGQRLVVRKDCPEGYRPGPR
jgi:aryl-alcohol dehydrogenase-like predicted oxidoreductase